MGNHRGLGLHFISVTIILVATISICFGAQNTTVACYENERLALLKFKHSVRDVYDMLSSWVGNDCCSWERVGCDGVTENIESLGLKGSAFLDDDYLVSNEVSASIGDLRHLKYLDLSGNNFQGSQIPEFIGSLKQLTYLNISCGSLSGIIPHHIRNLSNLRSLDLSSNMEMVDFPNMEMIVDHHSSNPYHELMTHDMAWISGLSSLEHLDLSCVHLGGAKNFDMVFYIIPSLKELRLSVCGLTNADLVPLYNASATLSNIRHLDLSRNSFEGQLPHFLRNMTSLQFLDISFFDLSQAWNFANLLSMIPSLLELHLSMCNLKKTHMSYTHFNFSGLSNIQHLDLSRNFLPGRIPSTLANMTSLRALDLSDSFLNSPVSIMPNLLELDLSANYFEQMEDLGIWRQCHLKQLSVAHNDFFMKLSHSQTNISECSGYAFERLDLNSSLDGTILNSLERMTCLRSLDLSFNELTCSLPESLGRLRLLQVLDLSNNELMGPILTFHGKLTKLDLSNNHLNGSIPKYLGRLKS